MTGVKEGLYKLGYPDGKQSAVWFPFLPEPSYEPEGRNNCEAFLVFKRGLPKVLVFPKTSVEQYEELALNISVFCRTPPVLIGYSQNTVTASAYKHGNYLPLENVPTWNQLDDYDSGCLSEERAEKEILAVRNRMYNWLQDPFSEAAVQGLMRVHVQRGAIVQELIQNACDCFATRIVFNLDNDTLVFRHDGHPFMPENVHAITALNLSCKPPGAIGYKGIGFKAVYQVCRRPEVMSWPFRFAFEPRTEDLAIASQGTLCPYLPVLNRKSEYPPDGLTEFCLPLVQGQKESIIESLQAVSGAMLLFIAAKGMSLRSMQILDHFIELPPGHSVQEGAVSVLDNGSPSYWFISKHEFTIDMDRQSALIDFSNSTSRIDFRNQPAKEQVVVAVPLSIDPSEQLVPNANHIGRFYSFLPTKDSYRYPWDMNANFLVDEPRDHLRFPAQGSWNEVLLHECGNALLSLLDVAKKTWQNDSKLPICKYYNLIPQWAEAMSDPQFSTHFKLIEKTFSTNFRSQPRVPVFVGDSLRFVTADKCVFIESSLRSLFPLETWLRFLPIGKELVLYDLDDGIWRDFLCSEGNAAELYTAMELVNALCNIGWLDQIAIQPGSAEVVSLIGRICAYLAPCSISSSDLASTWIIPSSPERLLYRSTDMPNGKSLYRMPEEGLSGLPAHVLENIAVAHDGVIRFLQHDASYFKGDLAKGITDEMAALARKLWTGLIATLDFDNVTDWLNVDFAIERDSDLKVVELRDEWLRFLMRNRDKLTNSTISYLDLRLLARLDGMEVWNPPKKTWLFEASPQGRDVEDFIASTPGVALLSKHYATIFTGLDGMDDAKVGAFFIQMGVQHTIKAKQNILGSYDPDREINKFCQDLGIPMDSGPQGDINYNMNIRQYSLPEDMLLAFKDSLSDGIPQRRLRRLGAFGRLLQAAWPDEISKRCHKEGSYHLKGAHDDAKIQGGMSNIAIVLRDTEWIPLTSDNKVLKRPRDTCLLTEESIKYADVKVTANYADILLENDGLIKFLGFQSLPIELSSLDAMRTMTRNWENSNDPRKDFEDLYSRLASELDRGVSVEEARYVFRKERLIFIPTKPPVFRSSEEVLVNANAAFRDFFDELSNYYSPIVCSLFKRLGVSDKVQDVHYLRYLVSYIWQEKPAITEVRREMILKVYRRLVEWAKDQTAGQGIWVSPEGRAFAQSTIFYGNCAGKDGWFPVNEKTMVYRDDPQIEAILANKDQYVLESHLPQLRRNLGDLEPFLTMFSITPASKLSTRKVSGDNSTMLNTSTNFRQNIYSLTDVIGQRLPTTLPKDLGDNFRASLFAGKIKQWQSIAVTAEVIRTTTIWIEYPELMKANDKPTSCDAAIDLGTGSIRLLIAGDQCTDVSPAIGRELKQVLRTDTLPEQAQSSIERVIEDVSGSLDRNPDSFQHRMREVLVRHLPTLTAEDNTQRVDDMMEVSSGPRTQTPQPTTTVESPSSTEAYPKPDDGITPEPKPIVLPDFDSQNVTMNEHRPQDFTIITDQTGSASVSKDRHTKRAPRLFDKQRQEIGRRAELLVLQDERNRLAGAGHPELIGKVIDRNEAGYDPDGPYDIDSVEQDENGEWRPIKIEVKGHLDPDVWGFELSRPELETALNDFGSPYYVYLVFNLRDVNVQVHKLDFRKLWLEKRLNYRSKRIDIALRPT